MAPERQSDASERSCTCSRQATFGDQLHQVLQIDQVDTSASVPAVNEHLDMLRPAIRVQSLYMPAGSLISSHVLTRLLAWHTCPR